jgi:hypothetical protein
MEFTAMPFAVRIKLLKTPNHRLQGFKTTLVLIVQPVKSPPVTARQSGMTGISYFTGKDAR